ncbi:MAG: SDR family NAD(P)-dependent oxidoreductase, partial [Chloroflexota bacterium]|nr:SDR family NAD(P)-dependent oxidoreductase [Chloroflexota bacterium]
GGQALAVPADLSDPADQARLIAATMAAYGRLDVLVNNAGLPLEHDFADSDPADLRRQWDVNVTALVTLTRLALPHLEATGGMVINIGSMIGRVAVPGWGNYSPTKVAVAGLTDALRRELAPRGVYVCLVEPGPIATEFYQRSGGPANPTPRLSVPAPVAAQAIVRLFTHPQRRITIPAWLNPLITLVEWLARLAPPLTDAILMARQRQANRAAKTPVLRNGR